MFTSGSEVDVAVGTGMGVIVGGMGVEVEHALKRTPIRKVIIGTFFIFSPLIWFV
jgi:hypothetical protein